MRLVSSFALPRLLVKCRAGTRCQARWRAHVACGDMKDYHSGFGKSVRYVLLGGEGRHQPGRGMQRAGNAERSAGE